MWDFLIQQVINQIAKYFDTFAIFCASIILVSGFIITQIITRFIKEPNKTWKWIVTFLISLIASLIGFYFDLGIFEPLTFIQAIIVSVGTFVVAIGLYETPFVQIFLEKIGIRLTPKLREKFDKTTKVDK